MPERKPALAAPEPAPAARPYAAPAPAAKQAPLTTDRRSATSDLRSPAVAALIAELDQRPASEWLARIASLRRDGRSSDADALVAEFKRRFPDEPLPPSER
jgi:hypothetical protein